MASQIGYSRIEGDYRAAKQQFRHCWKSAWFESGRDECIKQFRRVCLTDGPTEATRVHAVSREHEICLARAGNNSIEQGQCNDHYHRLMEGIIKGL